MCIFEPLFSFTTVLQISTKQNDLRANTSNPYANDLRSNSYIKQNDLGSIYTNQPLVQPTPHSKPPLVQFKHIKRPRAQLEHIRRIKRPWAHSLYIHIHAYFIFMIVILFIQTTFGPSWYSNISKDIFKWPLAYLCIHV